MALAFFNANALRMKELIPNSIKNMHIDNN